MKQKREHLDEVIERVQLAIANSHIQSSSVMVNITDIERIINASIWGDD